MRTLFAILGFALLTGCHESGTWTDDARNWKRIFGVAKPDDITVVQLAVAERALYLKRS